MNASIPAAPVGWRALLRDPLLPALLLLLPVVFLLQPLPIDETRYLAVAWEMRVNGEYLVPHLNGAWYSDKPPLLFWLVNLGWLVTGVHAWTARAMTLLCSIATVLLTRGLARRLGASPDAERTTGWLLLGTVYFAAFANAVMFDVLLATCVLAALFGVLDIEQGHTRRGVIVTGVAIGLGILAKGPVMLLDIGFAVLTAPWWSEHVRARKARFFGAIGLSVLLGILVALAWAIPAALHGGPEYAHAIFLHQTVDRVAQSFAHRRPIWWYAMVLPVMLLPWTLALVRWPMLLPWRWRAIGPALSPLRDVFRERAVRFAIGWTLPTILVFSLISGKQPHYLLPVLPGIALLLAVAISRGALTVRALAFGVFLIALGAAFVWLPSHAADKPKMELVSTLWPLWGWLTLALGVVVIALHRVWQGPGLPALAAIAVALVAKLAVIQGPGVRYDVRGSSEQVQAIQARKQPIVHLGWHHGLYEFAGRLTEPLVMLPHTQFAAWTAANPDGLVISFYKRYRFRATPIFSEPFRGGMIGIWRAQDALAGGVDPSNTGGKNDGDFTPSDDDVEPDTD